MSALGGSYGEGTALMAVMLQRLAIPADYMATIFVEVAERLVVLWTEDRDASQVGNGFKLCKGKNTVVAAQLVTGMELRCYVTHVLLALQTA